jgi:spheroidene monooxygenase
VTPGPTCIADGPVAVMLLADIAAGSRLWGWSRFVLGRFPLRAVAGLQFSKILGSGYDGGFGLKPSASRLGLFCLFGSDAEADRFIDRSAVVAGYRAHASECFTVKLRAFSSRGSWSGSALPVSVEAPSTGPIATLTRASIRPRLALRFWRHAPPSERSLAQAAGCRLAAGVGEAPLLRQATFSVWDSVEAMERYARSGAHLEAIRASRAGDFFTESMFVRFVPYAAQGRWKGCGLD